MFRWNFARSAEVFFSRWAIKRVCKFLLKKKLGDFILGDIDVDQLEVQLSRGTLYLSDLAVNVDYLNQKLAGAAVMVREGSVASLSIKIPWKLQNCQIELEELELVFVPFVGGKVQEANNCLISNSGDKQQINLGPDKIDTETGRDSCGSVSVDIHEGVKTIAKIVKWFLTSFHIKLKNLIVAFDPCLDGNENKLPFKKSLVLRIAETEFGTCLSEDVEKAPIVKPDCLLGVAKLTNFVKFEGAVVEVLKMNDIDKSSHPQGSYEAINGDSSASSSLFGSTSVILAGRSAGFAGRVNLSIPWKNGSLDIHKVDADISFDPIELRLQPNTIGWIIILWETFISAGSVARSCVRSSKIDSSCHNSRLQNSSSLQNSVILGPEITKPSRMRFSEELHPGMNDETFLDDRIPRTYVIQDWVPLSLKDDQTELEQDYGQSIDQFFECFDELRSSQANSGCSGLWNWTYSVFSAINVASNLAYGSGHMLAEQQHVETCLRTTVSGVSFFLYFHDKEDNISDHLLGSDEPCQPDHGSPPTSHAWNTLLNEQSFHCYRDCLSSVDVARSIISEPDLAGIKMHHLEIKCEDAVINFQIGSPKMDCQISVKHVKINEYYDHKCHAMMLGLSDKSSHYDQMLISKTLKQKVLAALSPFPVLVREYNSEASMEHKTENISENISSQESLVKVGLMETFGDCSLSCVVSPVGSDGCSVSLTSFSVHFPPCILWFHFHLAYSLLNLFKEVDKYFEKSSETRDLVYDYSSGGRKMVSHHDLKSDTSSIKSVPTRGNVQGKLVFAQTRIIICFPLQTLEDFRHVYPMDKFIIFEHCPMPISVKVSEISPLPSRQLRASNCNPCTPTFSVHLEIGTFDMYMVDSIRKDATIDQSVPLHVKDVSAVKFLSMTNRIGDCNSGINVIWQKGPVTGPWMAGRAWSLASTHNNRSRNKVTRKDCEFSSVTAVEDFEEINLDIRQELILSSAFLLHLCFSIIEVNLRSYDYRSFNYLLDIVMRGLSNGAPSRASVSEEQTLFKHDASQVTIIMDCDLLDICITLDKISDCSHSIQKELVDSWNCFKLIVEKFEIMSVSNIGGIRATNLFWLNHGEGKLWGSILTGNDTTSATIQDVLLISCNNSVSRRGGGDGANVLSFGSAGSTITFLCNPQLFRSYTSILVRCGTIVLPGGRLDWISCLCSFFSFPSENESSCCGGNKAKLSSNCKNYEASFFFDLVDVALSYEPYLKHPSIKCEAYVECDDTFVLNKGISEQFVGCLLAAASLSLSNYVISDSGTTDYDIQIQDLGLLICESSGSKNDYSSYDATYLQKTGYAKVASGSLLVALLKIHDSQWEVECSDPHVNFDTCHDTTHGLFRLIAQLQQLYAPDMEDTLAYLQSRWNNVQQSHNTNGSNDASDNSDHSSSVEKKLTTSDRNSLSNGLLDGIIENAFNTNQDSNNSRTPLVWRYNSNAINPNSSTSLDDISSINMSIEGSVCNLGVENFCSTSKSGLNKTEKMCGKEECLSQHIDSYYFSEIIKPSLSAKVSSTTEEDKNLKFDMPARADVECGKGGWYKDGYLMIVENHIPNSLLPDTHQHHKESKVVSADSSVSNHCNAKGKIVIKNLDVRWSMFSGSDWSKLLKSSTRRDGSLSLELILAGLNVQYMIYPDGEVNLSKLSIHAQDFHLYDRSSNAPWKTVIGYYNSRDHPRESYAKAFKLDLETVRPDPGTPLEDYRLYLECLPIRLHLDQSQINFLISFFSNGSSVDESPSSANDISMSCIPERKSTIYGTKKVTEEALLPFFQKCEVKPMVMRVDYIPHHLDMSELRSGNYVELLNLVPWKGIDLQLKHVCAVGVYGWGSVCETVLGQWLEDISHNQVHKLLKGLAPVRSLVSVASGTSKLVTLPVKSYKRDKKLLKGMQRGAIAFVKSISLEAVGLGVHLAAGTHEILHQVEYILTNVPPDASSSSDKGRTRKPAKTIQPEDAQEGIRQAYESLSDGLGRTASAILGTAIKEYRRGAGAGSALATAVRATPAASVAPVTASAQAMHCALLGMRNSLDPEHKKESVYKYLGHSRP